MGRFFLPPFHLRLGGALCLHVSFPCFSPEEAKFVRSLTADDRVPGLHGQGPIAWAAPVPPAGRGLLFREPTVMEWLRDAARLPPAEAQAFVVRHRLQPAWKISSLAGTPNILLALESAHARGCEMVLYSTAGLDPLGIREVHEVVSSDSRAAPPCTSPIWTCNNDGRVAYTNTQTFSRVPPAWKFAPFQAPDRLC